VKELVCLVAILFSRSLLVYSYLWILTLWPGEVTYNIKYVMRDKTKIVLTTYDSSRNYELKIENGIEKEKIANKEEKTSNCPQ
jgi:hypothetical protein